MVAIRSPIPRVQRAIIAGDDRDFKISNDVPVPELEPDLILINTAAVALNPVDTKLVGDFVTPGVTFGFDCAGVVVAVGSNVTRDIKPDDLVCGSADGMNKSRPNGGGFAEYVTLHSKLALKIPHGMSTSDAASLGTAIASASMALFWSLRVPASLTAPPAERHHVLVYGGSSATGTMTIQLVKACGLIPVTTCSPANFDLVKSYGAEAAFDYKSPTCAEDIRSYTNNELEYAVDCITQESSIKICYGAIGRAGGYYTALDPFPEHLANRKVVKPDWILATRIAGMPCHWPAPYESAPNPDFLAWSAPLYEQIQRALDQGEIRPHPVIANPGGFEAVLQGVGKLRRKEVSGQKLVYLL
ncbi:hypothetical protein BST61_g11289 [Cercospora zeina]